jgi:ribulose 1,5-bisphosphate synthetase/thiazole synthase
MKNLIVMLDLQFALLLSKVIQLLVVILQMTLVLIIGTDFSGIIAPIVLTKKGIHDFLMLERRAFDGGTWLQYTYLSAAVDAQSP